MKLKRVILVVEMERNEGRGGSVVVLSGFFMGLRGMKVEEFHMSWWAWW